MLIETLSSRSIVAAGRGGTEFRFESPVGGQEYVPPPPIPRDKRGWNVAPAPDGRGMPEEQQRRPPHRHYGFWVVVFVLLALNWTAFLMSQPAGQRCGSAVQS